MKSEPWWYKPLMLAKRYNLPGWLMLLTGLTGLELSQYREGDIVIPITLCSQADDRQDIGKLQALAVYSQATGSLVPLTQVADIKVVWQSAKVLRRDHLKTITIGGQIDNTITANQAFNELLPWLETQQKKLAFNVYL